LPSMKTSRAHSFAPCASATPARSPASRATPPGSPPPPMR
jgi:hypothetical protein